MSTRKSYKSLSFSEKVKILEEIESKELSQVAIAKKYGISESTLSTFKKNKESILRGHASSEGGKRNRQPEIPDIDQAVTIWFSDARNNRINLDGNLIRSKAEEFAKKLGHNDFKASAGWFSNWKKRNNVVFKTETGESGAVDVKSAAEWMLSLDPILREYDPKNIFNADETGFFYKCTPNHTFAYKGDACFGGKKNKERVTVLVGANMDGSEKLPLLLIGKSPRPHCFRHCKTKPIEYKSNQKAWMTGVLFQEWLQKLDQYFIKRKRTILLFIDNCTAHNNTLNLRNIKLIFFPPNMTSVVQPMDMGIIKNLKTFYRQKLVKHLLAAVEAKKPLKIDLMLASRMLKESWNRVTPETVQNCFKKAGFFSTLEPEVNLIVETPKDWNDISNGVSFEDYVDIDENLSVFGARSDEDIVAEIQRKKICLESSSEDEEEEDSETVPTFSEATDYLNKLMKFVHAQENVSDSILNGMQDLENFVLNVSLKNKKQKKLSVYFK